MSILILAPYPPYPPYGGGTMRIYQLIRGLAARHQVTCLTFAPDAVAEQALAPLHTLCRVRVVHGPAPRSALRRAWTTLAAPLPDMALRNVSHAYAGALTELLASEQFDIVQAESIEMAGYLARRRLGRLKQASKDRPQLVLDQFNAEFVLQKRAALTSLRAAVRGPGIGNLGSRTKHLAAGVYSVVQWRKLVAYERRVMRSCDVVLAVSDADRATLLALQPKARIGVVPNGVDSAYFSRSALASALSFGGPTLVFTGTLDFRPNIDALLWFAYEVLPLIRERNPDVRLLVVGRRPAPVLSRLAADRRTTIVGEVPDARPYIAGAAVYIVPMRIGGGVRLKLLEALSLEAPVVSTTMGAEGVSGLRSDQHCLLADQPDQFAAAVLRLLEDPARARRLGAAGRALVRATYDWLVIVPQLEAIYTDL